MKYNNATTVSSFPFQPPSTSSTDTSSAMAPTGTMYQPLPKTSMDVPDEKSIDSFRIQADDCACSRQSQCAHGQQVDSQCTRHQHRSCHNERRKRALRIASACLAGMMLTALALVSMSDGSCLGDFGFGLGGSVNGTSGESLWKRQGTPDGTGTGDGQQGVFVRNRCV